MYVINRILHDHLEMQNVTFCVGKNFVSPYGHVISSIFGSDGNQPLTILIYPFFHLCPGMLLLLLIISAVLIFTFIGNNYNSPLEVRKQKEMIHKSLQQVSECTCSIAG